jgi:hypothetical protein
LLGLEKISWNVDVSVMVLRLKRLRGDATDVGCNLAA